MMNPSPVRLGIRLRAGEVRFFFGAEKPGNLGAVGARMICHRMKS